MLQDKMATPPPQRGLKVTHSAGDAKGVGAELSSEPLCSYHAKSLKQVFSDVCLSVHLSVCFSHVISKSAAAKIIKLHTNVPP